MIELQVLKYADKLLVKHEQEKALVYDPIRKKYLILTPEEMVRQCLLQYLLKDLQISKNLIRVEQGIEVIKQSKRCDIIVYNRNLIPYMIIECKNPRIKLDQKVFNQIALYNMQLKVPYLLVSNGHKSMLCVIDFDQGTYEFLSDFPSVLK